MSVQFTHQLYHRKIVKYTDRHRIICKPAQDKWATCTQNFITFRTLNFSNPLPKNINEIFATNVAKNKILIATQKAR